MNVVDSSGWLEYFADEPNADFFAPAIERTEELIVPSISVFEVFKHVLLKRGEGEALQAVVQMKQGLIVELDVALSISAARLSAELRLPMPDSIILATARRYEAEFWTQDADFSAIEGVRFKEKGKRAH